MVESLALTSPPSLCVTATIEQLASGKRPIGEVLSQHTLETGCDIIVMRAYGLFWLRERIFGGVTACKYERCQLPVFLSRKNLRHPVSCTGGAFIQGSA